MSEPITEDKNVTTYIQDAAVPPNGIHPPELVRAMSVQERQAAEKKLLRKIDIRCVTCSRSHDLDLLRQVASYVDSHVYHELPRQEQRKTLHMLRHLRRGELTSPRLLRQGWLERLACRLISTCLILNTM